MDGWMGGWMAETPYKYSHDESVFKCTIVYEWMSG